MASDPRPSVAFDPALVGPADDESGTDETRPDTEDRANETTPDEPTTQTTTVTQSTAPETADEQTTTATPADSQSPATTDTPTTTAGDGPGFGVLAALLGVGLAALALARRR